MADNREKENKVIKAPFQYFGSKSTIAGEVWRRFGPVYNFVEPFCGSAAVLLARPDDCWPDNKIALETINDMDGFIANFWRVFTRPLYRVRLMAKLMNYPVCEVDLEARHKRLVSQPSKDLFIAKMKNNPRYCSAVRAAWWCWGLCQWIGRGWCAGEWYGPGDEGNHGCGVCNDAAKRPHLGAGMGVHKQLPHLGAGRGVHKQLPHLGAGQGVHKKLPHLGDAGRGEYERRGAVIEAWMFALADRLRAVRVCCGDWLRVCGSPATTTYHGLTGVFLDPPYSAEAGRANAIYSNEDLQVAHRCREWCLEHGDDPLFRIAICGYSGEGHDMLVDHGWSVFTWKTRGGYANKRKRETIGKANRFREVIWFSPNCLRTNSEKTLFKAKEGR